MVGAGRPGSELRLGLDTTCSATPPAPPLPLPRPDSNRGSPIRCHSPAGAPDWQDSGVDDTTTGWMPPGCLPLPLLLLIRLLAWDCSIGLQGEGLPSSLTLGLAVLLSGKRGSLGAPAGGGGGMASCADSCSSTSTFSCRKNTQGPDTEPLPDSNTALGIALCIP